MSVTSLEVFVANRSVATLSTSDGFEHHLTYNRDVPEQDFVSLLMPVRPQSWTWPTLHPFFQQNLPEGYLLSVLQEQLGPQLGGTPLDLLSVVGSNMIGRVKLSFGVPSHSRLGMDLDSLLHGARSMEVFMQLLREHAASGVSGVVPKFLSPEVLAQFRKASVPSERYIIKGSSERLPFLALNEHLCMQVASAAGAPTAKTHVSDDGQVLLVERFDVAAEGSRLGFEDCCGLLGLTPAEKYQSTWERIARTAKDFIATPALPAAYEQLALTLLLTYALGNADCHTKNLGLLYSASTDVRMAPVYDMLTILAYDSYAQNPPGMFVGGRKDWTPGKALTRYLAQVLQQDAPRQRELIERVCTAVAAAFPELLRHAKHTQGFIPVAERMAYQWAAGLQRLSDSSSIQVPGLIKAAADAGLHVAAPAPSVAPKRSPFESPLASA
jgi:serine/threonine-protein kinase HipA